MKGELLISCGGYPFVLSVEVAFYHPGGVGAAVQCSGVQNSTQSPSRSLQRFPEKYECHGHTWLQSLHLFLTVASSRGKNSEEFRMYDGIFSLFSCCEHTKIFFILVHVSSSLLCFLADITPHILQKTFFFYFINIIQICSVPKNENQKLSRHATLIILFILENDEIRQYQEHCFYSIFGPPLFPQYRFFNSRYRATSTKYFHGYCIDWPKSPI